MCIYTSSKVAGGLVAISNVTCNLLPTTEKDRLLVKNYQLVKIYNQTKNFGRTKLSAHEVELLRKMVASKELTQKEAAEKFEVSKALVSMLVNYKRR